MLDLTFQSMNVQIQKAFQSGERQRVTSSSSIFQLSRPTLMNLLFYIHKLQFFLTWLWKFPLDRNFRSFLCPCCLVARAKIVKCKLLYAQGNAKYLYLKVFSQLISIQYKSQDKYFYKKLYFAINSCFIAKKSKKLSFLTKLLYKDRPNF